MLKHRLQATFICLICVWWNAQEKHIIVTEELFHCLLRFCLPWWFNNLMLFMNPLEGKRDFSSLILKVHQTACSVFFPRWIVATVDVPPKPSENSFSGLILHEVFGQNQSDSNFRPQKVVSVHWCHSVRYSGRIYSNFVVRPYEKPLCAFWILWYAFYWRSCSSPSTSAVIQEELWKKNNLAGDWTVHRSCYKKGVRAKKGRRGEYKKWLREGDEERKMKKYSWSGKKRLSAPSVRCKCFHILYFRKYYLLQPFK